MNGKDRWQRISNLFDQALELAHERRAAFLERATDGDHELQREVESLLRAEIEGGGFLEGQVELAIGQVPEPGRLGREAPPLTPPAGQALGDLLGSWRISGFLGRGGMGEVYLAERADGRYQQRVAIKLLQPEATHHTGRFAEECRLLARLQHPGIARLYDAGVAPDGRPFMVMEHVEGETLAAWCQTRNPDLTARLQLFLEVCAAVAYAHANLVVHRDLKPANILVTPEGRVKLLDFGVGKALDGDAAGATLTGAAAFTPEYAAPEHVSAGTVTTATDVYALGLLLFELLTGRLPWAGEPVPRVLYALLHEEAPTPSSVSGDRAQREPDSAAPDSLPFRLLRGDLDAIVAKCLRKEPARRYPTVDALAQDVRRHLGGEPVAARAGAKLYVLGRLLRRHRLPVAAAALLLLALCGGVAGTLWQAAAAREQAEQALRQSQRAEAAGRFLARLFEGNDPDVAQGRPVTARDLLDQGAHRLGVAFEGSSELRAEMLILLGSLYRKLGDHDAARPLLEEALHLADASRFTSAVSDALYQLAYSEMEAGRFEEALQWLAEAEPRLAAAGEVPGLRHALLMEPLVSALGQSGRAQEASERAEAALALARADPRLPAAALFHYLNVASNALIMLEQREQAEVLLREAVALDFAGADEPSRLRAIHGSLATILEGRGELEAALAHKQHALALADQIYPPVHALRAQNLNNLGVTLLKLGRLNEAEEALRGALEVYQVLDADAPNPRVAAIHHNLGTSLSDAGRYQEALPHAERARELAAIIFGRQDPRYASATANLGVLLTRLRRHREADQLLVEALETRHQVLGRDHHLVGVCQALLAELRLDEGRPREALELAEEALALYRRIGWESPSSLIYALARRARALAELGRPDEADEGFEQAIALGEAAGANAGQEWPRLLAAWGHALLARDDPRAEAALARALAAHRETFGDTHPATRHMVVLAQTAGSAEPAHGKGTQPR